MVKFYSKAKRLLENYHSIFCHKASENQPQVYIVKNDKALLQNITISNKIQNKAVVSSGLNEGDVIVTNGFINLLTVQM
ncbi:MAG: hypothetical protein IPP56_16495 [Bacteroidetes bacterium]|nr:hypothetical protein [Bacteroidota bacterium]